MSRRRRDWGPESHEVPAKDYAGHHYPATGTGGDGGSVDHSHRPAPLGGSFATPMRVAQTGEVVTIVQKVYEGTALVLLTADDPPRRFRPAKHGTTIVELP